MPFFSSTLGLNQENGRTTRAQTAVPVKTTALSTAPTTQTTRQVMENISNRVVQARTDATVGKTRSAVS
ncbi:hypothetical protein CAOG_09112 [Capsaspora owczarzaki ATCC 30864]|uniref:Uncharacterized protein n=1 Tax=Capsaspora owczarzaki (strain ATCC 30864) TaxID=595528 RepID=A0A0D2WWZ8_CAPO3|nr:hypothetical protein CAOG_09112 [Capsaspora owczarzaki ATCC 30864]KJE97203.1 hypothetical protein CAOG_009112 [Capsaspora owczarzaki ATCC 30864]|eukprot:XP_011270769.1 hypothetical protein CAOG_09112 [Capsaspora owczarzaki ATCC 30864]